MRPQLEELQMLHQRLSHLSSAHDKTSDELRMTREALKSADENTIETRRDLEECLQKLRSMQDRQGALYLVEKEASFLRGTLESRQRQHDEALRENAALALHLEDAQKAMLAATQELRELQQRALAGTVTSVLVEEVEALRMEAKEAAVKRDLALQDGDKLKLELAGVKARLIAERKVVGEHRALQSTCTSWDGRIKVLEMHNLSLSQDLEQSRAEMQSAREIQLQVGQERSAGAERECEYKARIASLDAQLRVTQLQSQETAQSLQALLADMWALKNENKHLFGDLCAAAAHAADVAALAAGAPSEGGRRAGAGPAQTASVAAAAAVERAKMRDRSASGANSALESEPVDERARETGSGASGDKETQKVPSNEQQEIEVQSLLQEVHTLQAASSESKRHLDETLRLLALQDQLNALLNEQETASKQDALRAQQRQKEAEEDTRRMEDSMMALQYSLEQEVAVQGAALTAAHQLCFKACRVLAKIAEAMQSEGVLERGSVQTEGAVNVSMRDDILPTRCESSVFTEGSARGGSCGGSVSPPRHSPQLPPKSLKQPGPTSPWEWIIGGSGLGGNGSPRPRAGSEKGSRATGADHSAKCSAPQTGALGAQSSEPYQPSRRSAEQQEKQQLMWRNVTQDAAHVQNNLKLLVERTLDAMPPIDHLVAHLPPQLLSSALGQNSQKLVTLQHKCTGTLTSEKMCAKRLRRKASFLPFGTDSQKFSV